MKNIKIKHFEILLIGFCSVLSLQAMFFQPQRRLLSFKKNYSSHDAKKKTKKESLFWSVRLIDPKLRVAYGEYLRSINEKIPANLLEKVIEIPEQEYELFTNSSEYDHYLSAKKDKFL